MDEYVRAAPPGFHRACEAISALPPPALARLCDDVLLHQEGARERPSAEDVVRLCGEHGAAPAVADAAGAVRAADFVLRGARLHKAGAEKLGEALARHSELGEPARAAFVAAWGEHAGRAKGATSLRLDRLVGFDWKLGVGVRSSHCRSLKTPFVAVTLRVADSAGRVRYHPLELSLKEFNELSSNFKQMAKQLGA